MTKTFTAALLLLATPAISLAAGTPARPIENTWDYSVQVSAVVELAPAKVTLTWPQDMNGIPSSYSVSRRTHSGADWSTGTVLPGKTTSFVDSDVKAGRAYEYRIVKVMPAYTAYGYISAGVRAPLVDRRGKLALIVDDRFSRSLAPELERLE